MTAGVPDTRLDRDRPLRLVERPDLREPIGGDEHPIRVGAIALKLCPAPSAFIRDTRAFRTVSHKPPTTSGATDDDDANETFPAQFRGRASVVMAEQ